MNQLTLGEALKKRIKEKGLTNVAASHELGISDQALATWIADFAVPRPNKWAKLAEFLECSELEVVMIVGQIDVAQVRKGKPHRQAGTGYSPQTGGDLRKAVGSSVT